MLYRKQGPAVNLWLLLGTALLTLVLGFVAGRLTAPRPTLTALLVPDQQHLRQASGALDIVLLEYDRAVQGNPQSREASLKAVAKAQEELANSSIFKQLFSGRIAQLKQELNTLRQAVQDQAPETDVRRLVRNARTDLDQLAEPTN